MAFTIEYFNPSVQAEINGWPAGLRAPYRALALRMLEHGPDLGMPHTRALGGGLYAIRAKAAKGIGRATYCTLVGRRIVILHGFVTKTKKTPIRELDFARNHLIMILINE